MKQLIEKTGKTKGNVRNENLKQIIIFPFKN